MVRGEMGYLGNYNKRRTHHFEGFDVGGSGMTGYNIYGVDVIGLRVIPTVVLLHTAAPTEATPPLQ